MEGVFDQKPNQSAFGTTSIRRRSNIGSLDFGALEEKSVKPFSHLIEMAKVKNQTNTTFCIVGCWSNAGCYHPSIGRSRCRLMVGPIGAPDLRQWKFSIGLWITKWMILKILVLYSSILVGVWYNSVKLCMFGALNPAIITNILNPNS